MSYLKDQKGVALVLELVLVAVVLAAAGFGVYATMRGKGLQATTSKITSSPTASKSAAPTPSPAKPANEFDIPEFGIKMTIPAGLHDLKYIAKLNQTGGAPGQTYTVSVVTFSTTSLEQADSKYCSADTGPIGLIAKYTADPRQLHTADVGTIKHVGNSYFEYDGPMGQCSSHASANNLQWDDWHLLSSAFDTASSL